MLIERLEEVMHEKCINKKELAEMIGVNKTSISHWFNERRVPKNRWEQIAELLGYDVDYFFECENTSVKVSIKEGAKLLGMSQNSLKLFIKQGKFKEFACFKQSGQRCMFYINRNRLMRYLKC